MLLTYFYNCTYNFHILISVEFSHLKKCSIKKEKKSFSKMDKYPKQCESSNVSLELSPVEQS